MPLLQNRFAVVGIAAQSAKGTPATNATYAHGLTGGVIIDAIPTQAKDPTTANYVDAANSYREAVVPTAAIPAHAYCDSIGLYLLAAMGTVATTGNGTKTHVFSVGDHLPELTVWARRGKTEYFQASDMILNELTLSWEGSKPLEMQAAGIGCGFDASVASMGSIGTDETDSEDFFTPIGGTFEVDVVGQPALEATILSGSIALGRSAEALAAAGSILPEDVDLGEGNCSVSLTLAVSNLNRWRDILTGAVAGSTPTHVQYGSFEVSFKQNRNTSGDSLTIAGSRVAFTAALPDVDPAGMAIKLPLEGEALQDGATSPIVPTLVNSVASYGAGGTS